MCHFISEVMFVDVVYDVMCHQDGLDVISSLLLMHFLSGLYDSHTRDRDRDRGTNRHGDRDRDREGQTDRETEGQTDREAGRGL